ncbi:MAG: hypothetical protein J6R82_05780 [Clostridia bacterium]|nr:hypothetical protein [Clostridia bacterium]
MKKFLSILLIAVFAISMLPISAFAAEPVRYEAEDAVIGEGAQIRDGQGDYAAAVSGGKFVGGFDNRDNAVTFTVTAENSGNYLMTIGYISMDPRSFDITVNGNRTEDYAFTEATRSWDGDTKTYTMNISLSEGENTIIFGQLGGNAPSLDYIELEEVVCKHNNTEVTNAKEAALGAPGYTGDVYCNDCERVITPGTKTYVIPEYRYEAELAVLGEDTQKCEIRNAFGDYADSVSGGKFVGGFDNYPNAITFTVNVEKAGTYEMVIGYISMDPRSFDITVNDEMTQNYAFTETGNSWEGDTKTYTMEITLNAGDNTIIFGQDEFGAPSLDYIDIHLISEAQPEQPDATEDAPETTETPDPIKPAPTGDLLPAVALLSVFALAGVAVATKKRSISK